MAEETRIDSHFFALIFSLKQACLIHLGKIMDPITKKLNRNLEQARVQIDILEMLKEKTKGNLTEEERRLLFDTVAELQLNYLEELKKEEKK
ncbi:MAG: DUF1844 domain-containing protein [Caldiserica bacterium]|nr:MAG: DUF1844 domain-containing protein [Caldisericota bacterium]